MDAGDTDHTPPGRDLDEEIIADAVDVLEDSAEWMLAEARWERVLSIIDRLSRALEALDAEAFQAAVADLELSGPVRALRIGTAETYGIPEPVLDRRNTMLNELRAGAKPAGSDARGRSGKEGDGGGRRTS